MKYYFILQNQTKNLIKKEHLVEYLRKTHESVGTNHECI